MSINANHCNLAFEREIERCKQAIAARVPAVAGHPAASVLDRLMQRTVELSRMPYTVATSALYKSGGDSLPAGGTQLDCGRATLELGSGAIRQSPKQWLLNQSEFLAHWMYCLTMIWAVKKADGYAPATLVFGVGEESILQDGSDHRFARYCRNGPIAPLREGKRLLLQMLSADAHTRRGSDPALRYVKKPMLDLLQRARLGLAGRMRLTARHAGVLLAYAAASVQLPQLALIGKDFAYVALARELDRRRLMEAVVLTCSSFTAQPLWMRDFSGTPVHMIWYAQNWKPFSFVDDPLESDIPFLRWIRVDAHWVWTEPFAQYLKALTGAPQAFAVGPIVWSLPERREPARELLEIAVFDVSPYSDEVAFAYGEIPNYNHPDNVRAFVQDILWLKAELESEAGRPVALRLKTKRGYKSAYDRAYFDLLEKLAADGAIALEHHSTDIYSLISGSRLAIVYPYSSPAYVADYLGVPAIYYDPVRTILPQNFGGPQSAIRFAAGREELLAAAHAALADRAPQRAAAH